MPGRRQARCVSISRKLAGHHRTGFRCRPFLCLDYASSAWPSLAGHDGASRVFRAGMASRRSPHQRRPCRARSFSSNAGAQCVASGNVPTTPGLSPPAQIIGQARPCRPGILPATPAVMAALMLGTPTVFDDATPVGMSTLFQRRRCRRRWWRIFGRIDCAAAMSLDAGSGDMISLTADDIKGACMPIPPRPTRRSTPTASGRRMILASLDIA